MARQEPRRGKVTEVHAGVSVHEIQRSEGLRSRGGRRGRSRSPEALKKNLQRPCARWLGPAGKECHSDKEETQTTRASALRGRITKNSQEGGIPRLSRYQPPRSTWEARYHQREIPEAASPRGMAINLPLPTRTHPIERATSAHLLIPARPNLTFPSTLVLFPNPNTCLLSSHPLLCIEPHTQEEQRTPKPAH